MLFNKRPFFAAISPETLLKFRRLTFLRVDEPKEGFDSLPGRKIRANRMTIGGDQAMRSWMTRAPSTPVSFRSRPWWRMLRRL